MFPFDKLPDRNDFCWCGSRRKYKSCHAQMDNQLLILHAAGKEIPTHAMIKTPQQIDMIRQSAKINIAVLDEVEKCIREGMSLGEIDQIVGETTSKLGGIPAPLDYKGYPYSVCTSVNDQVCHGYPTADRILRSGDIVNVDCSTILNGFYSDSSRMFCIVEVDAESRKLVEVTRECVELGLKEVRPYACLGDIAQAINDHAQANGYSVVEEIGGHGVGLAFHEDPWVGYTIPRGTGMVLVPGMIFTIEPMVNMGSAGVCGCIENDWEIYTEDGSLSAQWELMVLVTENSYEVLSW